MAEKQQDNSKPERGGTPGSWKPGQSGNPRGRPPSGHALADLLREAGDLEEVKRGRRSILKKEALARKLWDYAIKGNIQAARLIFDRIDGKAVQPLQIEGNTPIDAQTIINIGVEIEYADDDGDPEADPDP